LETFKRTRLTAGIGKAVYEVVIGLRLQAVNNKRHHARNLLGALVSASFTTPQEQKTSSRNITVQNILGLYVLSHA
jgi:hypothetical protein